MEPGPATLDVFESVCVPPLKASVAAAAEPVKLPLLLPPPARLSVPLCTSTVPLLFTAAPMVLEPVPALFLSVPLLLKVGAAPPWLYTTALLACRSQVALLLMVAPTPDQMSPPLQVVGPAVLSVRCVSTLVVVVVIARLPVLATVVVPVPVISPPVQLAAPLTVRVALPPSVPLLIDRVVVLEGLLKLAVPPLMVVPPPAL